MFFIKKQVLELPEEDFLIIKDLSRFNLDMIAQSNQSSFSIREFIINLILKDKTQMYILKDQKICCLVNKFKKECGACVFETIWFEFSYDLNQKIILKNSIDFELVLEMLRFTENDTLLYYLDIFTGKSIYE
jgi:hypothetical protein